MYDIPTIHVWSIKVMQNNISTKMYFFFKWIDSLFHESGGHVFFWVTLIQTKMFLQLLNGFTWNITDIHSSWTMLITALMISMGPLAVILVTATRSVIIKLHFTGLLHCYQMKMSFL